MHKSKTMLNLDDIYMNVRFGGEGNCLCGAHVSHIYHFQNVFFPSNFSTNVCDKNKKKKNEKKTEEKFKKILYGAVMRGL